MKIAMMVRGYIPVPRPADIIYAPIDLAVDIAKGLSAKGHEVTFFAPQGSSIPSVTVDTLCLRPLVHNQKEFSQIIRDTEKQMHYVPNSWDHKMCNEMFSRANKGQYDLLYFHHPEVAISNAQIFPDVPIAYTMHDPFYGWYRELFDLFPSPNQHFISISNNQRRDAPDLNYTATIYNGIDPDKFTYSGEHEDYLLFAGRIVPEKGIKEAIQVAEATNHRLLIIGPVYDDQREYFEQYIKPHLNDKILYLGFMEQEQVIKYYQKAKAFLMPLQWEEPFGLVMTESMACGTPVIALRRGAAPEVIDHGKTGFICDHIQDMADAVAKVDTIDRRACRDRVIKHFTTQQMVDNYEQAFLEILHKKSGSPLSGGKTKDRLKTLSGKIRRHMTSKKFTQRQLF